MLPPFLRPREQSTIAAAMAVLLAIGLVWWVVAGGMSGRLVDIDRKPAVEYQFLVDVNTAAWPAAPSLQLWKPLAFSSDDLREPAFDHRVAPAVEGAAAVILPILAKGPCPAPDALAAIMAAGFSRSAAFKVKTRYAIASVDGCWALPVVAIAS